MSSRASVKTISAYVGVNPPKDVIDLRVDQDQVRVGSDVTGSVRMLGQAPIKSVHLLLEGVEYSVVAIPRDSDDAVGMEQLRQNTSEKRTMTKQEMLLDCAQPQKFRFSLPANLPSTTKCQIEGSDPILPSQCQIIYTISATIYGNRSKTKVTHNLMVLPAEGEPSIPVDHTVYVTVGFTLGYFLGPFFSCGYRTYHTGDPNVDNSQPSEQDKFITLTSNSSAMRISAGQLVKLKVQDLLGLLSSSREIWMIRLVEKVSWNAKGREASFRRTWDLFANQQVIPDTVRRTYDHDPQALLKVSHELMVCVAAKDASREKLLEATDPIPVQIV